MLAVLAASGRRGIARERLVALFWPESDEEHARQSARQALYAIRHELGHEVIRSSGTALSLDPAVITSDIAEARAALAGGEHARAVALMDGTFLDAFVLPGASGFERWLEEERSRLAATRTSALLVLANDATRAGPVDEAVEWWRQLTAIDPLSGRFAVGYLKALGARGDRAQALAFARQHALIIRRELETGPDPDVRRLEAELRAMPSPDVSRDAQHRAAMPALAGPKALEGSVVALPAVAAVTGAVGTRRRTLVLLAIGSALTVVVVLVGPRLLPPSSERVPIHAVGHIREVGLPDSLHIGREITDMLATSLARRDGMRVLANSRVLELVRAGADSGAGYSDAARRAGASVLLEGQVSPSPAGGLILELRRVDLRSGLVTTAFTAQAADRQRLVDSISAAIAREIHRERPGTSVPDSTPSTDDSAITVAARPGS